ncbi:MAG: DUF4405 domain-containing protein [Actinomycetia bacterium]|nr:DUF4405 domain-containing protein [Actinomycetes bacterium]
MNKRKFYWRGFTSIFLGLSGIILLLSSIALYLAPSSRVARDTGWSFIALDKNAWIDNHLIFGFAVDPFILYHMVINWRPFTCYIKKRFKKFLSFRQEFIAAIIFTLIIFSMSISNFQSIREMTHYFKGSSSKGNIRADNFEERNQPGRGRSFR